VETIFVLLPLALLIAAIAVGFFILAARTGQFDDLETPAVRILFDDEEPRRPTGQASSGAARTELVRHRQGSGGQGGDSTRRVSE
jgi:cbb3-type cytochrome oxidase maturation protein